MIAQIPQRARQQQEGLLRIIAGLNGGFADIGHVGGAGKLVKILAQGIKGIGDHTGDDHEFFLAGEQFKAAQGKDLAGGEKRRFGPLAAPGQRVDAPLRGQQSEHAVVFAIIRMPKHDAFAGKGGHEINSR